MIVPIAQAQTFTVIHSFSGPDGANPVVGLTIDRTGNLYGTTETGGPVSDCYYSFGCGTAFKLSHHGSGWALSELYQFSTSISFPDNRVIFGPDGSLYGTLANAVYNLRPPASFCRSISCPWSLSLLFTASDNTGRDLMGDLAFDAAGNIYGTAELGASDGFCSSGCGTVYQLVPSDGGWTENLIHQFDGPDGYYPASGVIIDASGNLYGVAPQSFYGYGMAFQMTNSGSGWTYNRLYQFENGNGGAGPWGGLIMDSAGNLYGATAGGGPNHGGAVFELSPGNGGWNLSVLSDLSGPSSSLPGPMGKLVMDSAGNLYGASVVDGAYGWGSVFKLTPSANGWIYTDLHDFTAGSDGAYPYDGLVIDADGNLYGTAKDGGNSGSECDPEQLHQCGVVFEITP